MRPAAKLGSPLVKGRTSDAVLTTQFPYRNPVLGLLQDAQYLAAKALFSHAESPGVQLT